MRIPLMIKVKISWNMANKKAGNLFRPINL
jgi:hypothetical protein